MGGVVAWAGYDAALKILIDGHGARGEELLAELDRLRTMEAVTMEIEAARYEREKRLREKKGSKTENTEVEHVAGDLDDFMDAAEDLERT